MVDTLTHVEQDEIDKIHACIMEYVQGVVEFDFEKGMKPWHSDGLKISYDSKNGELVRETILQSRPNLTQNEIEQAKSTITQKGTIESIDSTGSAAGAKLVWTSKTATTFRKYTDYILLLKIEGEWLIVSKVFHIEEVEID